MNRDPRIWNPRCLTITPQPPGLHGFEPWPSDLESEMLNHYTTTPVSGGESNPSIMNLSSVQNVAIA